MSQQKQLEIEEVIQEDIIIEKVENFAEKLKTYVIKNHPESQEGSILLAQLIGFGDYNENLEHSIFLDSNILRGFLTSWKQSLKDFCIKYPNSIVFKDFIMDLNSLMKEVLPEVGLAPVLSLVKIEEPKEAPKTESKEGKPKATKRDQLEIWQDMFSSIETSRSATHISNYDEKVKIKIKVTESPDFADPFLTISGKIFTEDLQLIRNYLKEFENTHLV